LEWVLNKKDHSSSNQILDKKRTCIKCHDTDAAEIGDKIVTGKPVGNLSQPLDSAVPKGKVGSIPVSVQAAHDGKNIYLRFEWDAPVPGGDDKKMDPKNDVKLTVMFDDNKVELADRGGCWATCHQDLRGMPDASDAAKGHAKAKALGWGDGVTKYIKESRTGLELAGKPRGGWDKLKSDADIAAALKEGKFMDLIQFKGGKGEKAADGYVLESRHMDGGKSLIKAEGSKSGNHWTVVFERTLAGGGPGDHSIVAGRLYNIGFAIHDDHAEGRFHHVSLGYTLGLDNAEANFNAVKQ
jgi:cytochrome c-type protein NapC